MTLPALIAIALSFAVAMFCSWALLVPFYEGEENQADSESLRSNPGAATISELKIRKETMLGALEDLEADFVTKRIDADSYEESKEELSGQAAQILTSIDNLQSKVVAHQTTKAKKANS